MIGPIIRTLLLADPVITASGANVSPAKADIAVQTPYINYKVKNDFNYGKTTGKSIVSNLDLMIISEVYEQVDILMMAAVNALDKYDGQTGTVVIDSIDVQDGDDQEPSKNDLYIRELNFIVIWHVED